jgi:hypothetical protein
MGRRSLSDGVRPAGPDRIQFTFMFAGVRYRPTLPWTPTETTLRRARQHLICINARIAAGTFSFAEEFPDYRYLTEVPRAGSARTCSQVFDEYLAHCSARVARLDMPSFHANLQPNGCIRLAHWVNTLPGHAAYGPHQQPGHRQLRELGRIVHERR